ncbi:SDR family NAD(P)-dependent oxidoreductase [Mycobacterium kubicae]|nr:SDR family NAD(P)-dependent oxidoreductase [Mycobacterium kubicae]MCV7095661.1 SDR family NAD(P)-dependent oxidoreductase [Mycobacterium kubicae]ORW02360.1 oxidoreductase [Mycobacterium kubicae]QNI12869.1 SDR family NAD(P)-dependent oxidoreductase [Mycobacterium kubicae]QPI36382.1 SDR family NAD(P)-dependent oxidoreductase [Mycobacterium kubicae]
MSLALITGASSGIGFELAKQFASHGYDLVIAAEDDGIQEAAESLKSTGVKVRPVRVDLRTAKGVEDLYRQATESGQELDAVALNAGVGTGGAFVDSDLDADLSIVDLNVRSTVHLAKLVLPDMVRRNSGKLLFTSSIASTMPGSHQSVYAASKSFVQSLAQALHDELRHTSVTVTALMPGPTETNFFRRAGMANSRMGRMKHKDDPTAVAKQGFEALMNGDRKVVAESVMTKVMGISNRFLPDSVKAAANRVMSVPAGN